MCIHNVYVGKGDSVCDNGETAETEGRDDYSSPEVSEVILAVYIRGSLTCSLLHATFKSD